MTVKELYELTKQLMFEKPSSTIYDDYLVGNLNRLLVELFEENNMARIFYGKEKLDAPQVIPSQNYQNVEIEMENEYVRNVLPLGLAARFLIDDDLNKYAIFNTDYNNARVMVQKLVGQEKIDASKVSSII